MLAVGRAGAAVAKVLEDVEESLETWTLGIQSV
jgi:hypothetical protein